MDHLYRDDELGVFYVVDKRGRRIKPRQVKKNKRSRPYWEDSIKAGVTSEPPGKTRVSDLAAFYAQHSADEISAFTF